MGGEKGRKRVGSYKVILRNDGVDDYLELPKAQKWQLKRNKSTNLK